MSLLVRSVAALAVTMMISQPALSASACFRGINIAGAEFGDLGGKVDKAYTWPTANTLDYFAGKGFNTVRLPFRWERLQPRLMGKFDAAEYKRLQDTVEMIRSRGMRVIHNPHNYARYYGETIGSPKVPNKAFADFWTKLATPYANDDMVVFGLMNEPNKMPVAQWVEAANAATDAIRNTAKAGNLVLVPGTAWTGAHSWMQPIDGEPNGVALGKFHDPANNFAFEVHQYFDEDFSGTKGDCAKATEAVDAVRSFTEWLKANDRRGMLGEFGVPFQDPACAESLKAMVDVVEANRDVWTGWAYWAAGDWWPEDEELNIQPTKDGDRPQLQALLPALQNRTPEGLACPALETR